MTTIDFMRHGEPVLGRIYRGHGIDDELSDKGWEQMHLSASHNHDWECIISSPLKRCYLFANALSEQRKIPVHVMDNLKEVGFGDWEGKSPDQIQTEYPSAYEDFFIDPVNNRPEGAEPLESFSNRVSQCLETIVEQHSNKHILIIAHAGVIRAALGYVLQSPPENGYRVKIDNAAITRFHYNNQRFQLDFHNKSS